MAWIHQNRSFGLRGAKGRGNQHSRWDQAAKRVRSRINRHSDWFTRAHSPGCEVGGELQPLAIVFSPRRCRELSRFRRHGMQSERASLAKHDADQAGSQQHAQAVSDGLDDRLRISH